MSGVSRLQNPTGFEVADPATFTEGDEFLVVHEHSTYLGYCVRYTGLPDIYRFAIWETPGVIARANIVGSVGAPVLIRFPNQRKQIASKLDSAIDQMRDGTYDPETTPWCDDAEEIPTFCFLVTPEEYIAKQIDHPAP